jgi:DNA-binding SARP family transcriptional activator
MIAIAQRRKPHPYEQETHRMAETFDFRVLGPLEVRVDDGPGPRLPPVQRRLLAVLLARAGRQLAVDEIADAVWAGSPPPSAAATLQVHLHRLRRALRGSRHIVRGTSGYRIEVDDAEFDALRFADLAERGRRERARGELEAAVPLLQRALRLWRGDAYAGVEASGLVTAAARRLGEDRLAATRELHETQLDLGRHDQVIAPLTGLVRAHPYHERLGALLMLALYRSGRQADALEVYRARRAMLVDELGVEPGELLRRVHEAVLRADDLLVTVATGSLDGIWTPVAPAPAAGPAAAAPRELPMAPHHFTGRERELRALDGLLDGEGASPIAVVTGMGGVGKTSIAVHWGHGVAERFPGGQLFIDLRGQGGQALEPLEALTAMLGSLGVPAAQVPPETDQAAARFRSAVGDRRMLIVLDNAASGDQVRPLLPGGANCLTVVTSRHRLSDLIVRHGGTRIPLDALPATDARSLIERLLPGRDLQAEGEGVTELAERCGLLPLALHIAAANLADNPQHTIGAYVARLSGGDRLTSLQVRGSADAAIRAVFGSSYRTIPSAGRRLFRLLSIVPGRDFTLDAAARLAGEAVADTEPVLDLLVAVHLVEHHLPGRYRFHDLLRVFAEERAEAEVDRGELDGAADRLLRWYLHRADVCRKLLYPEYTALDAPAYGHEAFAPTTAEAAAWLTAERGNLSAAVRYAAEHGPPETAWLLNDALGGFMWLGVHSAEAIGLGRAVLAVAERSGDLLGRAAAELSLAWPLVSANRSAEAIEHGELAARLAAEAGSLAAKAAAEHNLAFAKAGVGRPREALEHAGSAMRANRDLGRRGAQGFNLEAMGGIHLQLGDIDTGIALLEETLRMSVEDGAEVLDATTLTNLGTAFFARGDLDLATAQLQKVLGAAAGAVTTSPHTGHLRLAAQIDLAAGRLDEAMAHAKAYADALGEHPIRMLEALTLCTLASVHDARGDHREAVATFDRALELTDRGSFYFRVDAMLGRSAAMFHLGESDRAAAAAERTLEAARGSGYRILEARALNLLAEIVQDAGRRDAAAGLAEAALRLHRETGHRPGEAVSLSILAAAAADAGTGERYRREALAIYADMGAATPARLR